MTYGAHLLGSRVMGTAGVCDKAPNRAFGGAMFGTQLFGFSQSVEGEITGDAIGISGNAVAYVGTYAVLSGDIRIGGSASGAVQLNGAASADVGIGGSVAGVVTYQGQVTGDAIAISGNITGELPIYGTVTGNAIGISGIVYAGTTASYDKVGARLITATAAGRLQTQTGRGRYLNDTVKGRF